MIYVTGSNGLIGSRFVQLCNHPFKTISYRGEVEDVFESHQNSCLVHFAWSTNTRIGYDEIERAVKNDVVNSKKLFDLYLNKNPNGKIIFLSSAGDLHTGYERTIMEEFPPSPKTLYGECKLQVENILNKLDCNTVILRVSNVWGGKNVTQKRVNGLIDKLILNLNTDNVIDIYTNLDTRIDIIHVDDLIDLINKVIEREPDIKHQTFLVGSQSLTIKEVIDKITSNGSLLLKIRKNELKTYLHLENRKARQTFNWMPSHKLV